MLCCAMLCCATLCCAMLCCDTLCCAMLRCAMLWCAALWCGMYLAELRCSQCGLKLDCCADPYADDFRRFAAKVPVVTYAINDKKADVYIDKVTLGIWESEIIINTPIGQLNILTPLIGRNNVYNVLAAVATGLSINVPLPVSHAPLFPLLVSL